MPEGDAELQDLYREVLLDYSSSGAHKGVLENPGLRSHGINPVCGDEIELTVSFEDSSTGPRIGRIRFEGQGCVISQSSAAMMAEALEGLSLERAQELITAFKDLLIAKAPTQSLPDELEMARALEGVRKFPVRVKCATLGWNTLLQGLAQKRDGLKSEFEEAAS
jgi:nitrogen fixation NifU-like protein